MESIKLTDIECTDNRSMSGIEELAANIAAVGLIQPIALAELEAGRYQVVAGRRRFRAVELLKWEGLTEAQYVICTAAPELAAFCENFHRANLTLAEEVEQFNRLKTDKLTIRELAALLGKTPEYVALRLNLANLIKSWKEVLNNLADYSQWTPAKLEIIAKQPKHIQDECACWINQAISMKELRERLERNHFLLSSALFNIDKCRKCRRHSGAAELLFPELAEKGDTCLDRECFEEKQAKAIADKVEELTRNLMANPSAEEFFLYYEHEPNYGTKAREIIDGIKYTEDKWKFSIKKSGHPNALCVWGENIGKMCRVEPSSYYKGIRPINPKKADGSNAVDSTGKKIKTLADREAELLAKRNKLAMEKMIEFLEDEDDIALLKLRESRAENFQDVVLALAYQFGTSSRDGYCFDIRKDYQKCCETIAGKLDAYLEHAWHSVSRSIATRLQQEINTTLDQINDKAARAFCEILNWNYDELFFNPAAEEIKPSKALLAARAAEAAEAK